MRTPTILRYPPMVAAAAVLLLASPGAGAARADLTGKQVVEGTCIECHETGKKGAPRIGNLQDWLSRMSHGMGNLADHAIRGYRNMPAHGKKADLSDLEISRAVAYMINPGSGAPETSKPYNSPPALSGEVIYKARCHVCHSTGKNGAPRIDDVSNWLDRMHQGVDVLAAHAVSGHNVMPSRGGMVSLSDAEIRGAVIYMITTTVSNGVLSGAVATKTQ